MEEFMPYNFKNANLAVRESRLGSITGFTGDLKEREWGNLLAPGEIWKKSFKHIPR